VVIIIGYPTLSLDIINIFVSIILLTIGVERVASGLMLPAITRQSIGITKIGRYISMGMGTIATTFAIIALSSPSICVHKEFYVLSLSINVIFNGFGKIVQGVLERRYSVPVRVFLISLGILSLGVAILVGHAEQFGTIFLTRILSLVLILYGMQMIFFGIMGKSALQKILKK
jgi:hypothetical protein